jgi:hypothetical protein
VSKLKAALVLVGGFVRHPIISLHVYSLVLRLFDAELWCKLHGLYWAFRFLLLPSVNVRKFGAVADGVTDDSEAINEAVRYLAERRGGTVRVPAGCYRIVRGVELRSETKPLRMLGAKDRPKFLGPFRDYAVAISGKGHKAIDGLHVDGGGHGTGFAVVHP